MSRKYNSIVREFCSETINSNNSDFDQIKCFNILSVHFPSLVKEMKKFNQYFLQWNENKSSIDILFEKLNSVLLSSKQLIEMSVENKTSMNKCL